MKGLRTMVCGFQKVKMKSSLPGFTLLEMLFVILLTSIVVSLTFTYFTAVRRYLVQINNESNFETEIMRFETFLRFDIEKSDYLIWEENRNFLLKCAGTNTNYLFGEKYIVRTWEQSDDTLFAAEIEISPEYFPENDTLIKSFNLIITDANRRLREYWFYKTYTIKTRFDMQFNNIINK